MILAIIKCYLALFVAVGTGSLLVFLVGLYFIFRKPVTQSVVKSVSQPLTDFSAIAGDDIITTQLDLARAYIETDKKSLAYNILQSVLLHGTAQQKHEAKQLMQSI